MRCLLTSLFLVLASLGCAQSSSPTQIILTSSGKIRHYSFREVVWRPNPLSRAPEFIGYGFIPYYNSPLSQDYDGTDDRSGFDIFWLHCAMDADKYRVTMTLPNRGWGYSPDDLLRGEFAGDALPGENETQMIELPDVPVDSRNHPNAKLTMSGTIIAKRSDDRAFERKLHQFDLDSRAYRNDR